MIRLVYLSVACVLAYYSVVGIELPEIAWPTTYLLEIVNDHLAPAVESLL